MSKEKEKGSLKGLPEGDEHKTRDQLLKELVALRREFVDLKILEYEREVALAALGESEERYRQIVETANDVIYRIDPRGYFVYANPCAVRVIGYSLDEIIGKHYLELVHPDYKKQALRFYLRQTREHIPASNFEFCAVRKDGGHVWLEQKVQLVTQGREIIELQAVARDITERKKAEVERRNLEAQLRHAQKMESIGRLAGGIAHDFNNILGIILAYTTVLEKDNLSPQNVKLSLAAITKAVSRAKGMVRELLTFARKAEPSFEYVNINGAITDFTKMIMETFPHSIAFSMMLDDKIPGTKADPNQFQQILLNLFMNARDAMPKGGTITVQTALTEGRDLNAKFPLAGTGMYVAISVSDTGVGMDESIQSRIFEPFFSTKEHGLGSGLGLAVVYGAVQSHNGFIDVKSEPGTGSTFTVYLQESLAPVGERGKRTDGTDRSLSGSETILFVEDEEMLQNIMADVLRGNGYTVLLAKDGIEAVELFMRHQKDIAVVLSDLGLPKLGGWEAYVTMREINPRLKVILASGYLEPSLKTEMASAGAKTFVQKPYEPKEVLARLRDVIESA